jgi:hypothetical protein
MPDGVGVEGGTSATHGSFVGRHRSDSLRYRRRMAKLAAVRPLVENLSNGDEESVEHFAGSYSKGLPHDALGHVDPATYASLLAACESHPRGAEAELQPGADLRADELRRRHHGHLTGIASRLRSRDARRP